MELKSALITLRAPEPGDVDAIFRHENAPVEPYESVVHAPVSRDMIERYVRNYDADFFSNGQLRLMIVLNATGEVIGSVDIFDYSARDRRAMLDIFIEEQFRGKGLGRQTLELLCVYASETLGLHQLAAEVAYDNDASRACFAAAGFKTCGNLRSWLRVGPHYYDVLIFQRLFS